MADAIDGRPAGAVDILLAVGIPDIAALGAGDLGELRSDDIDVGRQIGASSHGESLANVTGRGSMLLVRSL